MTIQRANQVVSLVILTMLALPLAGKTLEKTYDQRFEAREGMRLDLSNVNGAISIESWDRDEIWILAEMELEAGDSETADRAFRDFRIETAHTDRELRVRTKHPKERDRGFFDWLFGEDVSSHVSFDVRVPRDIAMEISTVNGRIIVSDVGGDLELDTVNGSVKVYGASGTVDASTVNGSIDIELDEVDPSSRMKLSTVNGGVELRVPQGAGLDLKATTTNGRVRSDLPILAGEISSERIIGKINGGGAELRITTTNGSIRIKS